VRKHTNSSISFAKYSINKVGVNFVGVLKLFINSIKSVFLVTGLSFISLCAYAGGGIGLGATRVIYPIKLQQVPLTIKNTSDNYFLIDSWVEDEDGNQTKDFIITPPVYVSNPTSENALKVIKIVDNIPPGKEKLYYINIKSVPSVDKKLLEDQNILQLAIVSKIKLLARPEDLPVVDNPEKQVKIIKRDNHFFLKNPTPYYINMIQTYVNGERLKDNITLEPLSELKLNRSINTFKFQTINDYGAETSPIDLTP
jgi:fimbrial chaperone protein